MQVIRSAVFPGFLLLLIFSSVFIYAQDDTGCVSYGIYNDLTPLPEGDFNFAIIGDSGRGDENAAAVAELVKSQSPEFIITLGDNNYPSGAAETIDENIGQFYAEYIGNYTGEYGEGADENRFFPALGNHDWDLNTVQAHTDYFTLPGNERYYDFVWENIHFFVLDSDTDEPDGTTVDSKQGKWFQGALAESTAAFQIVYFHHAPYASGPHGSTEWMQWPFEAWGVDLVLTGHNHHYERLTVGGIPYIVNGAGDTNLYGFPYVLEASQVRYNCSSGAMVAEVTETTIVFRFVTVNNEVIDQFEIAIEEARAESD